MDTQGRITQSQEYETLREELNQSKRYVFERPLAIFGVGVALMTTDADGYRAVLAAFVGSILLFNYWFTVNRLMSSARIVAYIYAVLEGDAPWRGWETSLREYRIWLSTEPRAKAIVDADLERDGSAIPDALMFYQPIYLMHIVLLAFSVVACAIFAVACSNVFNWAAFVSIAVLAGVFANYCYRWTPQKMRSLIERNVIIWNYALGLKKVPPPAD